MADSTESGGGKIPTRSKALIEDLVYRESPFTYSGSRRVVIVMDAMVEFSLEPLEWALAHVIRPGYTVVLLGVMPWLNLPLSCKTWLDVWTLDLDDLNVLKERSEWKHIAKYQKIRTIIELCNKYEVELQMKVAMGHPLRLVVLEQTISLNSTWVVFDRYHRRNRSFYSRRMPCNVVMMNNQGEADMVTVRPMMSECSVQTTPAASPALVSMVSKVIISEKLMKHLKAQKDEPIDKDSSIISSLAN